MATRDDFVAHLLDLFDPLAEVTAKRMFGGHGLFCHGLSFGLVLEGVLYLKADAESLAAFEARGLGPFTYRRGEKQVAMSYREAPPEALESRGAMAPWAERAIGAAQRSARRKPPGKVKA